MRCGQSQRIASGWISEARRQIRLRPLRRRGLWAVVSIGLFACSFYLPAKPRLKPFSRGFSLRPFAGSTSTAMISSSPCPALIMARMAAKIASLRCPLGLPSRIRFLIASLTRRLSSSCLREASPRPVLVLWGGSDHGAQREVEAVSGRCSKQTGSGNR